MASSLSSGSNFVNPITIRWRAVRTYAPLSCPKFYGAQLTFQSKVLHQGVSISAKRWHALTVCNRNDGSAWENDRTEYVRAKVLDAVSMVPLRGHLFMTLKNGREVEVDHINPAKGRLLYRSPNPTIFLKIIHDSDLILPIVVGEVAVAMLMRALHGEEKLVRPNFYELLRDVVCALDSEVQMVRITERVHDTYYARIYFGKDGDGLLHSVDARPSDAINLAVRSKVPIYVNKDIVRSDAVRPVYTSARGIGYSLDCYGQRQSSNTLLDSPDGGPDLVAKEITLISNMVSAIVEERYKDAARCRDELTKLRTSLKTQKHKGYQL
ncbi:hypothetical protein O6H91_02G028300 [Diphasiastrum complanatum]|uniref:Uncharacterized protein n=1 Tax=Diphasiastrum complanatum TaxID=34168 RepID=A0ACC2EE67_DIPCM|nr:hypothetical protein O6H91_02G028300 [Diphasiastrum complanatum]